MRAYEPQLLMASPRSLLCLDVPAPLRPPINVVFNRALPLPCTDPRAVDPQLKDIPDPSSSAVALLSLKVPPRRFSSVSRRPPFNRSPSRLVTLSPEKLCRYKTWHSQYSFLISGPARWHCFAFDFPSEANGKWKSSTAH